MSWRFKASKYKNAAPKVPKPDEWVRDLNIGSYQINGQVIKASASFMAFNADVAGQLFRSFQSITSVTNNLSAGSNLYVIPLNDTGRKPKNYPLLHAHSDLVTDLDFSPFDDGLLATGSQDSMVTKLSCQLFCLTVMNVISHFFLTKKKGQIVEHSRVWIVRDSDDARVSADSRPSASNRKRLVPSRRRFSALHFVGKCHDLVGHSQATRAHEYKSCLCQVFAH